MDIGEVKMRSGLPTSTLRFYEEKKLIEPIGRNGLRRVYDANVLERLSLIALGREAGFTLDEIGEMFTSDGAWIDCSKLLAKADQLDKTISQLKVMSKGLRHAANCPAPNHFECPKFRKLMSLAINRQSARRGQ